MRTIKLKSLRTGGYALARAENQAGPDLLVYAIHDVPDDVTSDEVLSHVRSLTLVHRHTDAAAYEFEWGELAALDRGSIVNRMRMGRPPLPDAERKTATIPPIRCSPEQRAKWERLGGADWLRRVIDRAKA